LSLFLGLTLAFAASSGPVFVGGAEAQALVDGGATVLDARGDEAKPPFLPGARPIDWKSLRDGTGRTGRLDDDTSRLKKKLEALGVSSKRAVLVYGAMRDGWGEEGRIWWMLRYLGHGDVHILDGGIRAWIAEGRATSTTPDDRTPVRAELVLDVKPMLRADWRAVDEALRSKEARVIDTRSPEEWNGATPNMEVRGGHVPGARHLEWASMIGEDGRLLPKDKVLERTAELGITARTPVITYCTGGVRSAFLQAVLVHYGFDNVANYDGSWFDWSRRASLPTTTTPRIEKRR
jgi:thiosulfate/3-mercaptopyruvate sulfurtransferase